MTKKLLLLLLLPIIFLIVLQPVYSIGLAHGRSKHYFEPNKVISIDFQVRNPKSGTEPVVYMEGDLVEYAELTEPDADGRFQVIITLPSEKPSPGAHTIMVTAAEKLLAENTGMIATLTEVKVPIHIIVPYAGQFLQIQRLEASNANIGDNVRFRVVSTSWGTDTITDAKSRIDIYNPNGDFITSVTSDYMTAEPEENLDIISYWDTTGMVRGVYSADATVTYSDKTEKTDMVEFRVGELLVSLFDYTRSLEINGLQPMTLDVRSEWSGNIANVYATVKLEEEEFKSAPIDLMQFQEGKLVAYIDTDKFQEGTVNGKATLYYGEDRKTTVEDVSVTFIKAEKELEFNPIYAVVIALIIIIFILIFLFVFRQRAPPKRR